MLPPNLISQSLPKGTVLDWSGNPIDSDRRPAPESSARAGRVRDPWLLQMALDVTPESIARMLRNDYPLPQQVALCNRMLDNDAHLASVYRDMVGAVAGLDWEILPFDDSDQAKTYQQTVEEWAYSHSEELEAMLPQLIAGEFYPLSGAGIEWDVSTYLPKRFIEIDPMRWYWDPTTNSLRIRTLKETFFGEEIPPNEFLLYRSALRPGKGREGGLWKPTAWLYLFKHFSMSEWMQFAEIFGKPFRVAYYNRREDKDSIYQAMLDLGANAAGVFPAGTIVELKEANRSGAVDVYHKLHEVCNDEMSELFVGHSLITHAKQGAGTLAGNGAQKVHEKIARSIARRTQAVVGKYLFQPITRFQHGVAAIDKTPKLKLKYEPPEDELNKAKTFVFVNQVLASVGEAIDPEQVRNTFNIAKTVPAKQVISPMGDGSGDPNGNPGGDGTPEAEEKAAAARRMRATNAARTPLETAGDVEIAAAGIGKKALEKIGGEVKAIADKAQSIGEFMAAVWEEYSSFDTTALASATRDAVVTAEVIGRGEVIE